MAGKRLIDIASLFNAAKGVAQKHIALRSQQLDVYSKTSTIAKGVKHQTDRVTETVKAARILTSRLNEDKPQWVNEYTAESTAKDEKKLRDEPIPSQASTEGNGARAGQRQGTQQDHFYEKSEANSTADPSPEGSFGVKQGIAARNPLPDGTIPPAQSTLNQPETNADVFSKAAKSVPAKQPLEREDHPRHEDGLRPTASSDSTKPTPSTSSEGLTSEAARTSQRNSEEQLPAKTADSQAELDSESIGEVNGDTFSARTAHVSPSLSSLPRTKIPKVTDSAEGGDENVRVGAINADTFNSPSKAQSSEDAQSGESSAEEEQVPEGVNTNLFHSSRVAKLLGGGIQNSNERSTEKLLQGSASDNDTRKSVGDGEGAINENKPLQISTAYVDFEGIGAKDSIKSSEDAQKDDIEDLAKAISIETGSKSEVDTQAEKPKYEMRESRVPSTRIGRIWNYSGLAAGMFGGAISESLRRATGSGGTGSYMLSAGNMDRLVAKLSRMRGAALKLGQMMSFQDSKMLPAPIAEVLSRVQDSADYMPASQRDRVLAANLGSDWRDLFSSFEDKPLAAASIGQVHSAVLASNGQRVAVKIQYPGVAASIDSDLDNLSVLLTASRLLPPGLFLDKTIANARTELAWECDYEREAACLLRFGSLLAADAATFGVPRVYAEASARQVLTMEFMGGVGVAKNVEALTQSQRDWIGTQILRLCLREITEFRFMQTDPNWTNFLYNAETRRLELLDFGASREFPAGFVERYTRVLLAASRGDTDAVRSLSLELGYLTGAESATMRDAHVASVMALAEPFSQTGGGPPDEPYDFRDQTVTDRVRQLIPVMVRERLAPPPEETYSLHRKLSGAFLLCAKLGSRVRCRELFLESMRKAGLV